MFSIVGFYSINMIYYRFARFRKSHYKANKIKIKTMENYTISKESVLALAATSQTARLILTENFPDAFKKELEVGKWYRNGNGKTLFLYNGTNKRYGFNSLGFWSELIGNAFDNNITEATPQEVETALIAEAKKRGFKKGVKITWEDSPFLKYTLKSDYFKNEDNLEMLVCGDYGLMVKGQWAKIIPEETKEITMDKAVKILSKKYGKKVTIK